MSLQEAPYAFSSTYDSALKRGAESWHEQVESTTQGSDRATFLSFSDDVPIGIAALYRLEGQADAGEIIQVWVSPAYRGTTVAWDLINVIFRWASENGFRTLKATVTGGNSRAVKFYTKYGFSICDDGLLPDSEDVHLVKEVR
jgi:GNAT superfamily N-acetyltransferase